MKKILSAILMLCVVLSLTACKMNMTAEERQEYMEEKESERVAQSIEAEEKYSEGIVKNVGKIGKSKKDERLVVRIPYAHGELYHEFNFNKKGVCQSLTLYYFFDDVEMYEMNLETDTPKRKIIKKDKDARMIVFNEGIFSEKEKKYDEVHDTFLDEYFVESGYEIIK